MTDSAPWPPSNGQTSTPLGVLGAARILTKWLPLVGPLGLFTLFLAYTQTADIDPEYTSEVAVLLTGPSQIFITDVETEEVIVEDVNPLTALGGSLPTVARVVAIAMGETAIREQLDAEGLSPAIEIGSEARSPIILIQAIDNDPDIAAASTDRMVDFIVEDLEERQNALGAPEQDRIIAQQIADSIVGGADYGGRNRVRIAFSAVGLALSAAAAFVLEGLYELFRRYRLRRGGGSRRPDPAREQVPAPQTPAPRPGLPEDRLTGHPPMSELVAAVDLVVGDRAKAELVAKQAVAYSTTTGVGDHQSPAGRRELFRHAMHRARLIAETEGTNGRNGTNGDGFSRLPIERRLAIGLVVMARMPTSEAARVLDITEAELLERLPDSARHRARRTLLTDDRAEDTAIRPAPSAPSTSAQEPPPTSTRLEVERSGSPTPPIPPPLASSSERASFDLEDPPISQLAGETRELDLRVD